MGRLSKEEQARFSGAAWMVDFVKEHGLEAAEKELEQRGIRQMPLRVTKSDLDKFSDREKNNTVATVILMSANVLLDEFDYSPEEINRFIERFNEKSACLMGDYVSWRDIQKTIHEETGIFINIPEEFIETGE